MKAKEGQPPGGGTCLFGIKIGRFKKQPNEQTGAPTGGSAPPTAKPRNAEDARLLRSSYNPRHAVSSLAGGHRILTKTTLLIAN